MAQKFDINNFELDKVREINLYKTHCPVCGLENSTKDINHYCSKCGEKLWIGRLTEANGSISHIFPFGFNNAEVQYHG